jgi:hypothetical protein
MTHSRCAPLTQLDSPLLFPVTIARLILGVMDETKPKPERQKDVNLLRQKFGIEFADSVLSLIASAESDPGKIDTMWASDDASVEFLAMVAALRAHKAGHHTAPSVEATTAAALAAEIARERKVILRPGRNQRAI